MTVATRPIVSSLTAPLAAVVAAVLRVPVELVTPDAPFTTLGMDSLAAVELTAAIEDALGVEVGLAAVHECPDLMSLARFIQRGGTPVQMQHDLVALMRRDAILPPDITPVGPARTRPARQVFLTGATGFVGAHLVRTLLDETDATLHCLVRGAPHTALHRLRNNLVRYGLWSEADSVRLEVIAGDLERPLLGLSPEAFGALAASVDAIYHSGASVNWVRGYHSLRATNVIATREILRLACAGGATPVHFLSSLAVCYSTRGPRVVEEEADMLPAVDGLHLGYAQSKCVAESLVRAAAARGLPATITRPALVTGDTRHGRSNPDDLVSRLIAGCIQLGAAPDLDWRLDCVPVDHVARAVVRLADAHENGLAVAHLTSPRPRHWRECVLWMRLCGYDLELLPYHDWLAVLRAHADTGSPLFPLRPFFLREVDAAEHLTLPELHEESRRSAAGAVATRLRLEQAGERCPSVDTRLLDRYFDHFVSVGIVPEAPLRRRPATTEGTVPSLFDLVPQLEASLAARFEDATLRIGSTLVSPFDTDESIVAELTSWRHGTPTGLFRALLELRGRPGTPSRLTAIVKAKAADDHVLDVAESVAQLASPSLGETYGRFREWVGFRGGHLRELALYECPDPRLRRHAPVPLAVLRDDATQRWILVLEEVPQPAGTGQPGPWSAPHVDAALAGLAQIHAVWYERWETLTAEPWLAPVREASRLVEMAPLWSALAAHACARSPAWRSPEVARMHERLAAGIDDWAGPLSVLPRTLIHNDFNPRNLTIRAGSAPRLCAYDWELATVGLPQRDVAEFLCFTLAPDVSPHEVKHWLERSRRLLVRATGRSVDPLEWRIGFGAAMAELLVDRLAMYAMVNRFRPQRFLSRVVATWMRVYSAL